MPYSIEQEGPDKWCVYNNDTKSKVGEFPNRTEAMKKMKLLYRAEAKAEGEPEKKETSEKKDDEDDK